MRKFKLILLVVALTALPMIQNCGTNKSHEPGSVLVGENHIVNGWDSIAHGNYKTAEDYFKDALEQSITEAQRINANNGLGWAISKGGRIIESIPYFEIASVSDNEAKVGLASALIYRHQSSVDYIRAAELLSSMPPEKFAAVHSGLALTSAKVHALAALAYALSGDKDQAQVYINKAAALDSMMVGTGIDKLDEAFYTLGWKE